MLKAKISCALRNISRPCSLRWFLGCLGGNLPGGFESQRRLHRVAAAHLGRKSGERFRAVRRVVKLLPGDQHGITVSFFGVCVCVSVSNSVPKRHTAAITKAGGHRTIERCPTKLSMDTKGYPAWPAGRTCQFSDQTSLLLNQNFQAVVGCQGGSNNTCCWSFAVLF